MTQEVDQKLISSGLPSCANGKGAALFKVLKLTIGAGPSIPAWLLHAHSDNTAAKAKFKSAWRA